MICKVGGDITFRDVGFWFADLFFGLVLVCLFARLAWLSNDVFDSIELSVCARDVGFVFLVVVLLLIR